MLGIELVVRWLHLVSAVAFVGGLIYWRVVLLPSFAAERSNDEESALSKIRLRWLILVMITATLLLITGCVKLVLVVLTYELADSFPASAYHPLFGIKILIALAVFFLAARLAGRSEGSKRMRVRESFWYTSCVIAVLVIIALANLMKLSPRSPKGVSTTATETVRF